MDKRLYLKYNKLMKTRIITFITTLILTTITLIIGYFLIDVKYHGYLFIGGLFFYIYSVIYMLFGLPRLVIYFIYSILLVPILILVKQYQLLLLSVYTITVVLNPLSFLEVILDKALPINQTETFGFIPNGKYKTFYKYRRAMKERYHLPQVKKLYTKPLYQFLRTSSVILLFSLLIFLLTFSARDIILGEGLGFTNLLTVYTSFVLTMALMILYKSGFTSMLRVYKIFIFPAILFIIGYFDFNIYMKVSLFFIIILAMIGVVSSEIYLYYSRVLYDSYTYNDLNNNQKVYANALYEPFIYNEDKLSSYKYMIKTTKDDFNKEFHNLLVYFNLNKVILTAYVIKENYVNLYIETYNLKIAKKIKNKLDNIFNVKVIKRVIKDQDYYEKSFLHNHEYIISRAKSLAHLLKDLNINQPVIISTNMYFKNLVDANIIMNKYNSKVVEQKEDYISIETYLKVQNQDFLIETALRGLLLDMLVHSGVFIRVMVYY